MFWLLVLLFIVTCCIALIAISTSSPHPAKVFWKVINSGGVKYDCSTQVELNSQSSNLAFSCDDLVRKAEFDRRLTFRVVDLLHRLFRAGLSGRI